jgi:hypothetical protein
MIHQVLMTTYPVSRYRRMFLDLWAKGTRAFFARIG